MAVILSELGPRRFLQPGGGESKDLQLLFVPCDVLREINL